jgi:lipid-A-disaccharide synthase
MQQLQRQDAAAEFRFFGGDLMTAVGGTRVKHYSELAYMGFVPVLLHLRTILKNMRLCEQDIMEWQPDVVILVDYPGFNLKIAEYLHNQRLTANSPKPRVYYYIAPKIWAWKEYRIKNIKRDIDELFSILPFEVDFFEKKHHYPIHYVGNPTASEVREYLASPHPSPKGEGAEVRSKSPLFLEGDRGRLIALLAGSRKQEIRENLPAMIEATRHLSGQYDIVLAGAPSIEPSYYDQFLKDTEVRLVVNETFPLLAKATAALVTSGTATLETCMFRVPQVVCYRTPMPRLFGFLRKYFLKVPYVSLVNLIANREVVKELVANTFSVEAIRGELEPLLPGGSKREAMLNDYEEIHRLLGESDAPEKAANIMINLLRK